MKQYKNSISFILYFSLLSFKNSFLFSVIMAIYNTGRYLDDSIGCLVNQTIDFKKIQLILINDGSTDETEVVCLKYKNKYPKNLLYFKIEHSGVSKARNIGLNYATGKYINFLDPDDKWDADAFKKFLLFFKYYKPINFVSGRLKFFEASNDYHQLDYKFYKTRVVNLKEEYNCVQLSMSSSIIKRSLIKGNYFDIKIFSNEDTLFINNILLDNPKIGYIKEAIYYYRRRSDYTSVVQNYKYKILYYFDTINYVASKLIEYSSLLYNRIVPFIQFLIGYDIIFRIPQHTFKYLDSKSLQNYYYLIEGLLQKIEDKYILNQKVISNKIKIFALSKKYKRDLRYDIKFKNRVFIYKNIGMINLNTQKNIIIWKKMIIKNNILYLEGTDNFWLPREKYYFFCQIEKKILYPKYYHSSNYDFITMYGVTEKGRIIKFNIPLESNKKKQIINFYIAYDDLKIEIFTSYGGFCRIPPISNGYYISGKYIIKFIDKRINIFQYQKNTEFEFEKLYCEELKRRNKKYIIKYRKYIKRENRIKKHKKFEIWLINDKHNQAGGNGEYFFRYLKLKNPDGIKAYFVIQKNCSDYKRLNKLGNIIDLYSYRYKIIFLEAEKMFSSFFDSLIKNPFDKDNIYIKDLINIEVIFLHNGIIKDDLSFYHNSFINNYKLFIISLKTEYKAVLGSKYGYNKNNAFYAGFPNYDKIEMLENNNIKTKKNRIIIIIPTWRKNIEGIRNLITHESIYLKDFVYTEFFNFYNNLINNEKLLLFMKDYNYKGILCLHSLFKLQYIDFNQNEIFSVLENCNYKDFLFNSSLLITDYSSIFFDFAYLRKPVIYTHFDYDNYRINQYPKGYFDYKSDGFGPICKDIKCAVKEIIFEIKRKCEIRKKYLIRIKKFFKNNNENYNQRILLKITKIREISNKTNRNSSFMFFAFTAKLILYMLKNIHYSHIFKISIYDDNF